MEYSPLLLDCFYHPLHGGELTRQGKVLRVEINPPDHEERLHLMCCLEETLIVEARFKAEGSVALIGAAEYVCRWLEGKSINVVKDTHTSVYLSQLLLPRIKVHVTVFIDRAIGELIKKFEENDYS